ncbi:MAG: 2-methylaconitate cis-trans isomerase PrpF [Gammaproteobacteria bacterium]|nr:2-methylaconitate cis-trans isomerase PrpF [Gammaproteobacteria bacterium]
MRKQLQIPATYMRGGTSKGVFFSLGDLPERAQQPGKYRDALLLRIIGSPDPYGKHTDGMGGATSSTSKTVILSKSDSPDHDVNYLFGQVAIDRAFVDWSGNCGNLTAAVGAFAIRSGLVDPAKLPNDGVAEIRIWQQNISKTIVAHVPIHNGEVVELGDFELDGVTFPAAEVKVEFLDPSSGDEAMFPTGNLIDQLDVDGEETLDVTLINAGIPTAFFRAEDLGFEGTELQEAINGDAAQLDRLERIRCAASVKMGRASSFEEAQKHQHTPKIAFVCGPKSYTASSGKLVDASDIDLTVRALSMGKMHHAMMGTAAVAIATAAAIPDNLVSQASASGATSQVRFGHPSGTLSVGAEAVFGDNVWTAKKAVMSRSARILMHGWVHVPEPE